MCMGVSRQSISALRYAEATRLRLSYGSFTTGAGIAAPNLVISIASKLQRPLAPRFDGPFAEVADVAERFAAATSEQLSERALLRRIDSKFVASATAVVDIFDRILGGYAALTVPSGNVALYRSLYFDTPDHRCYHDHRRGRRIRHKVRIRHYPDRELTYLEVKTKRNDAITDKARVQLPYGTERLGDSELAFLRERTDLDVASLRPLLRIDFHRVSLIGLHANERVTFDLDLRADVVDDASKAWRFGDLVVIEVKQAPFCVRTPIMRAIAASRVRERSLSKYTIATALLHPELRRNRLLPDLRSLER